MELREHPELTGYYVSPCGDVYSYGRWGRLQKKKATVRKKDGYCCMSIKHPIRGHIGAYYLHHIVAETYLGKRPAGLVIDHIDRDKQNNSISNLRYVTQQSNLLNRGMSSISKPYIVEDAPLHTNSWWR